MAAGYKDFTAGAVLAAADLEDYCELQGIMRFASAAARTTALSGVLTEGLMCYLVDLNVIQVYTGSAWSTIGPVHGGLTSWTPAATQSGAVAVTVNEATYQRIGRMVHFSASLTVTGSGTGSNAVVLTLPVTSKTYQTFSVLGVGFIVDASAAIEYTGTARWTSSSTLRLQSNSNTGFLGATEFTAGLANTDVISYSGFYEVAADA